jgi:hypothetical protein
VSELQGIGRFKFHEGKLEEFKRLAAQAMEIARAKDTGTLQSRGAILATGFVSSELLGEPGAELSAKLADGPVRLFTPFLST